jgi:hypothetical protein
MTENFSDEKLFELCKRFGTQALEARRKFLGLLPEVNRREMAKKRAGQSWLGRRGFSSIFEFAKKLAGVNEDQVRLILNLKCRFEDKPALQAMLVNGEVSVNKLARVVSIATKENQEALAEQVKILPKSALETLVRDIKHSTERGLSEPFFGLPGQTPFVNCNENGEIIAEKVTTSGEILTMKMNLKLDDEIIVELHELQGKGININEILREALGRRRAVIAQEKEDLAAGENGKYLTECKGAKAKGRGLTSETGVSATPIKSSRYISVRVKKILAQEYGTKCAVPACGHDARVIHHTARFALAGAHDPHFLAPLCKDHHLIAHGVDGRFWRRRERAARERAR